MKSELTTIAKYLTDQHESKKHGGYEVYEDDKIKILYDTYYPNVNVYVKIDGKQHLAALFSGAGITQEYHSGAWEQYVHDKLYPAALIKKAEWDKAQTERKKVAEQAKNAPLNDAHIFN